MSNRSIAGWKQRRTHTVTLPSGMEVEIVIPNIPGLIKAGSLPNALIETALNIATGRTKVTKEHIIEQDDFYRTLVKITVKDPVVSDEDFDELPYEDVVLIAELATRQTDIDAIGQHIGGLHEVESFRTLRGLDDSYANLARM